MNRKNLDNDLLTVSEFSKYVGIKADLLRHYDEIGAFVPEERGDGDKNKYRYYSPMQITVAKMIRVLRECGVPLKEIVSLKENRNPELILKLFNKQGNFISEKIRELTDTASVIREYTDLLNVSARANEDKFAITPIESRQIILGEKTDFTGETGFMREFLKFCNATHSPRLNTSFPIGGYWENIDSFLAESSRPERFFSLDPSGKTTKEGGLYLIGYTRGYYGETNDLPKRITEYAEKNELVFDGPVYNIYVTDEISEKNPDNYLLEVSASVTEKRTVNDTRSYHIF